MIICVRPYGWTVCFFKLSTRTFKCYATFPNKNLLEIHFLQKRYKRALSLLIDGYLFLNGVDFEGRLYKWNLKVTSQWNFSSKSYGHNLLSDPLVENVICPFLAITNSFAWLLNKILCCSTRYWKIYVSLNGQWL